MKSEKVHFVSLGCPKNLVDSEIMLGKLMRQGYEVTSDASEAATVIVNTCGFIEDAKRESIQKIMEISELKKFGKLKNLVVAGCLAQRYKDALAADMPEADLFVGSGEFQNIDQILARKKAGDKTRTFFNLPTYLQQSTTPRINSQPKHRAYLKISEGCKKRCAFCAIPLIRGNLQSRTLESVLAEAKLLVAGGVKELLVISHDFTDYGWDLKRREPQSKESPYDLLKTLSDHSGAKWIRVLYLYPDGITDEMIELISSRENLVKYFDMPLQHINDQMLKSMNRRMTRAEVEAVLAKIRQRIPEAVIRTQFIVGFPGETEDQFQELLKFVGEQQFDRVGCFKYSPEEDTKAFSLPNPVDEETKNRRYHELMSVQAEISRAKQHSFIGKRVQVLVEGLSDETELLLQGRNQGQAPEIDGVTYLTEGEASPGEMVEVEITDSHDYDLAGIIVGRRNSFSNLALRQPFASPRID